jgi:hypothetical protein
MAFYYFQGLGEKNDCRSSTLLLAEYALINLLISVGGGGINLGHREGENISRTSLAAKKSKSHTILSLSLA